VLARFRPTVSQAIDRGLRVGAVGAAALLLVAGLGAVWSLPAVTRAATWLAGLALPAGAAAGLLLRPYVGTNIDRLGAHGLPLALRNFAPWKLVVDVRAQWWRGRTVVAVALDDGTVQRLPAPYDGTLLGRDRDFVRKLMVIRRVWETYREAEERTPVDVARGR